MNKAMDFIDDFIQEYKNNPCLWKADSVHFKNRTARQEAYLKLIDVASRHGEHYNVERTKQKINNLRCAFRHQLKKYTEFKNKGEKDEPYCPKRRYFESLMFLKDEETIGKAASDQSNDSIKEIYCKDISVEDSHTNTNATTTNYNAEPLRKSDERVPIQQQQHITNNNKESHKPNKVFINSVKIIGARDDHQRVDVTGIEILPDMIKPDTDYIQATTKDSLESQCYESDKEFTTIGSSNKPLSNNCRKRSSSSSSQHSTETVNAKCLKVNFTATDFEKLLAMAHNGVQNNVDDHYANFGKVIAYKLRTMDTTQAMYAEKLISDVLFQGQMKMLSAYRINQFLNIEEPDASKK